MQSRNSFVLGKGPWVAGGGPISHPPHPPLLALPSPPPPFPTPEVSDELGIAELGGEDSDEPSIAEDGGDDSDEARAAVCRGVPWVYICIYIYIYVCVLMCICLCKDLQMCIHI